MTTMQKLFGKPVNSTRRTSAETQASAQPSTSAAVAETNETLELVEKREAHVLRLVAKEVDAARAAAASNNQKVALECIKRKKIHEKELDRLSIQKLNLMQQEATLNSLKFNNIVLHATERGAAAIEKEMKGNGGVEGTERVLDRMQDAMDDARDMLDAGTRKMGEAADMDDADLLEELEQLELLDQLTSTTVGTEHTEHGAAESTKRPVPAPVPTNNPLLAKELAKRAEEERELAELAAFQRSMLQVETPMPMPQMAACC